MMSAVPSKSIRMMTSSIRVPKKFTGAKCFSSLQSDLTQSGSCDTVQSKLQNMLSPDRLIRVPHGFVIPEPKPLRVADGNYKGVLTGQLAAGVRLFSGIFVSGWKPTATSSGGWPGTLGVFRDGSSTLGQFPRPTGPLVLFENEADPQSRLVREACSMLDLSVEFVPTFHSSAQSPSGIRSSKASVVRLQDGAHSLEGACSIIRHLFTSYGPGANKVPVRLSECWGLNVFSSSCASKLRGSAGGALSANALPADTRSQLQTITLWGFEGSPFVRPVRETLSSLGLRHRLVPCARGSLNRDKLFALTGRFQAPYLQDPNTGISMFESGHIVKYLNDAYSVHATAGRAVDNTNTSASMSSQAADVFAR